MTANKKYSAPCAKCGNMIYFDGNLDHAKIAKVLGAELLCPACVPPKYARGMGPAVGVPKSEVERVK